MLLDVSCFFWGFLFFGGFFIPPNPPLPPLSPKETMMSKLVDRAAVPGEAQQTKLGEAEAAAKEAEELHKRFCGNQIMFFFFF